MYGVDVLSNVLKMPRLKEGAVVPDLSFSSRVGMEWSLSEDELNIGVTGKFLANSVNWGSTTSVLSPWIRIDCMPSLGPTMIEDDTIH